MDQSQYNQLKFITDRFMVLFSGRVDSLGALHGESIREPVTQRSYFLHLIGNASLGIYPLLDDGTCRFAAVDIDRDDREIVIQIREELWNIGLKKVFIERSKSKGYHIWIFFPQPVRAKDVRWIINSALENLGMRYEVFPKQDALREGEIGNYINLPYFGGLRQIPERRVIIDSQTFEPVPLESFLNEAERSLVSPEELELILEGLPPVPERSSTVLERPVEISDIDVNTLQVSERIRKLILGDFTRSEYESIDVIDPATGERVKYSSRSEADQAIISALLSRGYGDDVVFSVFEKYPTTGKYKEKEKRQDQYLMKSIENAKRFIVERREEKESSFSSPQPSTNPRTAVPGEKGKEGKGKKLYTYAPSTVLPDGTIIEMVYDPAAQETRFAVFREGEIRYEKSMLLMIIQPCCLTHLRISS
jgi:TOTE conflict system primase-like protein